MGVTSQMQKYSRAPVLPLKPAYIKPSVFVNTMRASTPYSWDSMDVTNESRICLVLLAAARFSFCFKRELATHDVSPRQDQTGKTAEAHNNLRTRITWNFGINWAPLNETLQVFRKCSYHFFPSRRLQLVGCSIENKIDSKLEDIHGWWF